MIRVGESSYEVGAEELFRVARLSLREKRMVIQRFVYNFTLDEIALRASSNRALVSIHLENILRRLRCSRRTLRFEEQVQIPINVYSWRRICWLEPLTGVHKLPRPTPRRRWTKEELRAEQEKEWAESWGSEYQRSCRRLKLDRHLLRCGSRSQRLRARWEEFKEAQMYTQTSFLTEA